MISMIIFDMAGTTVNEDNVVYKTLRQAIENDGYSITLESVLVFGAGKEKLQAVKDILAALNVKDKDQEIAKRIHQNFLGMLAEAYAALEVTTYEGTEELFDSLREKAIKVVLNTGYNRETALSLLAKMNWEEGKQFDLLVTADDVSRGRPYPDMILLAMEKLGVRKPQEVLKVGDSAVDIQEGKSAGCGITLGVTTGAQTAEQLQTANPDKVINSLTEIAEIVFGDKVMG